MVNENEGTTDLNSLVEQMNANLQSIDARLKATEQRDKELDPELKKLMERERPAKSGEIADLKEELRKQREQEKQEEDDRKHRERGAQIYSDFSDKLKKEVEANGGEFDEESLQDLIAANMGKAVEQAKKDKTQVDIQKVLDTVSVKYKKLNRINSEKKSKDSEESTDSEDNTDAPFTPVQHNIDVEQLSKNNSKVQEMIQEADKQLKENGKIDPQLGQKLRDLRNKIYKAINDPEKVSDKERARFKKELQKYS